MPYLSELEPRNAFLQGLRSQILTILSEPRCGCGPLFLRYTPLWADIGQLECPLYVSRDRRAERDRALRIAHLSGSHPGQLAGRRQSIPKSGARCLGRRSAENYSKLFIRKLVDVPVASGDDRRVIGVGRRLEPVLLSKICDVHVVSVRMFLESSLRGRT